MDSTIVLEHDGLRVSCVPAHGMVLTEIVPCESGVNLLWQRPDAPLHPFTRPAEARAGFDPFDEQVFAGGWFGMFPNAGIPGADDTDEQMHGTFSRYAWRVLQHDADRLVCELEVDGLRVVRTLRLSGGSVRVSTSVVNRSGVDREVSYGEHPCFSREVCAGAEITLQAERAFITAEMSEPGANRFVADQEFSWPLAQSVRNGLERTDLIPECADASHDHLCITLADPRITLEVPALRGRVTVTSDLAATRHLLFWRHFQPPRSPWQGDVFGIEMMSTPGRTRDDARQGNALRLLRDGEVVEWHLEVQWESDFA